LRRTGDSGIHEGESVDSAAYNPLILGAVALTLAK
jgi:hypothetical protein